METIEHPNWADHAIEGGHCAKCDQGYPHECPCGGMVHGEVVSVPGDGYAQLTHCDRCGQPEQV
jgi:gamma-glutamylcyclotransferase (GGCT)/AIG2-like uncharacterized protein YtfP